MKSPGTPENSPTDQSASSTDLGTAQAHLLKATRFVGAQQV